ncbi:MAG: LVIVD repeat-containing protein [Candidatus Heimdallarchaeota archaeon]
MKGISKISTKNHFSLIVIIIIFFGFLFNSCCGLTSVAAYPESSNGLADYSINKVGLYDTGYGSMYDLFVSGDYVYTAVRRGGMVTFDISDLSSPSLVSVYDDPTKEVSQDQLWGEYGGDGLTDGVFVEDNIAYLADGSNGLVILNVSSPEQPVKVGHYYDGDGFPNVFVKNDLAFVYGAKRIRIINVSNIFNPTFVTEIGFDPHSEGRIWDFAISNNYLFISTSDVLIVYDFIAPSNPVEVKRLENYYPIKLVVFEDKLYGIKAEASSLGLKYNLSILDISNPIAPLFLGECVFEEAETYIQSMVVSDSFVYAATYEKIFAINATDPNSPELVESIEVSHQRNHKQLALKSNEHSQHNGIVFCADYQQGLLIYNFSSPTNPYLISKYGTGHQAKALCATDDFVYLCTTKDYFAPPSTLDIISIEDPFNPDLVGRYHSNGSIRDIVVHQNLAFLALSNEPNNHSLEIVDVTNPEEPIMTSYFNGTAYLDSLVISYDATRKLLYIANGYDGYSIFNVVNYNQPTLIYSGHLPSMNIVDIDVKDNLLFIADGSLFGGFSIYNVSNPLFPTMVAAIGLGSTVFDIKYDSNMIYLTTDYSPLVIFDATNLFAPKRVSYQFNDLINIPGQIQLNDNFAFIAREANGLMVLDISKPKKIKSLIEYRPEYSGLSYDVTFYDSYILIADGWDGLEILELVPPAISKQLLLTLSIFPPFIGFIIVVVIVIRISLNIKKTEN